MSNALIIGYGVVGKAFEEILSQAGVMSDILDPSKGRSVDPIRHTYNILHICFPCYKEHEFINYCVDYITRFKPKYVLIHSTIGIFTADKIIEQLGFHSVKLFHIPIRGVELHGAEGIKNFISFVGPAEGKKHYMDNFLCRYLDKLGMKNEWVESARESALGKLVGTTWYGMNIAFANLIKKITDRFDISFHSSYKIHGDR